MQVTLHNRMPRRGEFFAARDAVWQALSEPFHVTGIGRIVRAARVCMLAYDGDTQEVTLCEPAWVREGAIIGTLDDEGAEAAHLRQRPLIAVPAVVAA